MASGLKKGMVVYHRSGIKGAIERVFYKRTPFTNNPPELAQVHVRFESALPHGLTNGVFQQHEIGSLLFLNKKMLEQAVSPINNSLNRISLREQEELINKLNITHKTLKDWSNVIRFKNKYGLNYAFYDKDTIYLRYYHPKTLSDNSTLNPAFDNFSKRIIKLKEKASSAINFFYHILDDMLAKDIIICIVPPSTPGGESGMFELAKLLAADKRIYAKGCLVRHTKINKLSQGGNRDISVHLNSIKVDKKHLIQNKEVLLLDDVITTGNSLEACRKLLNDKGVIRVRGLVLGKTYRDY